MLELPDSWVWDSWAVDDGERFHLFFLFASRALADPELRHRRASIGHAVSDDLRHWRRLPDALVRADAPAIDEIATWTGCTLRDDDGRWLLFYTGLSDRPVHATQRITAAASDDLVSWTRTGILLEADPRWYATGPVSGEEQFRDPWIWKHDDRWHMIFTASAPSAESGEQGVVGHAVSDDLATWQALPPLVPAGNGFAQFEVAQVVEVDGAWYLTFSCLEPELAPWRREAARGCGMWVVPLGADPLAPVDMSRARVLVDDRWYAGRSLRDRDGEWMLLPFEYRVPSAEGDVGFGGRLADPLPLRALLSAALAGTERDVETRAGADLDARPVDPALLVPVDSRN